MGQPHWPDGTPIEGVTVIKGKNGQECTFVLDFDLAFPANPSEMAHGGHLASIHQQYKFLPDQPELIRQADLNDIDACISLVHELIKVFGWYKSYGNEFILALSCACFRDVTLREMAILMDYENHCSQDRFDLVLLAIIQEIAE